MPNRPPAILETLECRQLMTTTLTVTTLADTLGTAGQTSLRDAIQQANAAPAGSPATIQFDPSLFAAGPATLTMGGFEFAITAPVTITGPGQNLLTLDAGNTSRVFDITAFGAVTLSDMTLNHGLASGTSGGAVYSSSTLTLTRCTIENSNAQPSYIVAGNGPYTGGGGIYQSGGTLTLNNCLFQGNTTTVDGAGVNLAHAALNATGCTFSGNSADAAGVGGGGIGGSTGALSLTNCTVTGNTSAQYGGGLFTRSTLTLNGCTISNNKAASGGGGALAGTVTISQTAFSGNTVSSGGAGALSIVGGTVSNSSFTGNSAVGGGGTGSGGGAISAGSGLTVTKSTFTNNATGPSGGSGSAGGGAINAAGGLTLGSCTFLTNTAHGQQGGAVYAGGNASAANCTFAGNAADLQGGGLYLYTASGTPSRNITDCTLSGNSADKGGGLFVASGNLTLQGTIVAGNTAVTSSPDLVAQAAGNNNLVQNTAGAFLTGTGNVTGQAPGVAPAGDYGGTVPTMALLPGSPALGAGGAFTDSGGAAITADARGVARPAAGGAAAPDIGAYQSAGFALAATGGDNQSAPPGSAFASPLTAQLVESAFNKPLPDAGLAVTFTAPASGASAALGNGGSATTAGSGAASVTATANAVAGSYTVTASAAGIGPSASFHLTNLPGPVVASTSVGDGTAQRSQVRQLTVSFSIPVHLAAGAFTLALSNSGGSGKNDNSAATDATAALGTATTSDGGATWVIPVAAGSAFTDTGGSLTDGTYTLTVHASAVTDSSGNPLAGGDQSIKFHRLFGDTDGNGTINALDYARFKQTFGTSSSAAGYNAGLDFDGNGTVNALDYAQFKKRFGVTFA